MLFFNLWQLSCITSRRLKMGMFKNVGFFPEMFLSPSPISMKLVFLDRSSCADSDDLTHKSVDLLVQVLRAFCSGRRRR